MIYFFKHIPFSSADIRYRDRIEGDIANIFGTTRHGVGLTFKFER